MELTFRVNGESRRVELADPGTPLVFVLRDALGLTGTKYSCLEGVCGVCTVHLDGVAVRSCLIPAEEIEGAEVTTIEGLSPDGSHPVQRAWIERRVPQCGYCQPGQIMQAAALLNDVPAPGRDEIVGAMSANLCRCGTGPRIVDAVARAAEIMAEDAT